MLDTHTHQAASLAQFMPAEAARIVPLLATGQLAAELAVLWQLSSALQMQGYSTAILDGAATESLESPGLADILATGAWQQDDGLDSAVKVWPSAQGIAALAYATVTGVKPLDWLAQHLVGLDAAVIYGASDRMIPLLKFGVISPLMVFTTQARAHVAAYQTVKQLLYRDGIRPVVVIAAKETGPEFEMAKRRRDNLRRCFRAYLEEPLEVWAVALNSESGEHDDEIRRLALRMLENDQVAHNVAEVTYARPRVIAKQENTVWSH